MAPRVAASIVASGSELVRGDRQDRNGPFLAASLLALGVEPARITVVGDDPVELEAALREGLEHDLLVVSGGLGPTHDDRTVELLARAAGAGLRTDEQLATEIEEISRRVAARLNRPYADFEHGVRKQATIPDGATIVGLAGTAPALVLGLGERAAVALPGPPRELQALWPRVLETESLRRLLARAVAPQRRVLRFYGASESEVARALAAAGGDGDGVDVTICARNFEIHVDLFVQPGAESRAEELEAALSSSHLFSREEVATAELVLTLLRERGLTLATAESCTGGLVAARLTEVPGSSDVFAGAVVAYANEVKAAQLGVPDAVLRDHGAVSAETAEAMARGARERLGVDVAVSVTGIAGPDGGTAEKPVGLVFLHASGPMGERRLRFDFPGDRETIRGRAATAALHLVRRLVTESAQT
ncbi:MAG: CinA family nicotinamide mononucleotide deamidase-related protein [Thermoleophilia bacterium]|nr:CinA family nicotinamide mononucleotide deamidase-related protein [Thermoleophilia bacterium]